MSDKKTAIGNLVLKGSHGFVYEFKKDRNGNIRFIYYNRPEDRGIAFTEVIFTWFCSTDENRSIVVRAYLRSLGGMNESIIKAVQHFANQEFQTHN